jgi:hypothetical protein
MSAVDQDFSLYRGESRILFVDLNLDDGTDLDLTGATLEWCVGKSASTLAADAVIRKASGSGISIVESGINIQLQSDDTADLVPGYYAHELKIFSADGSVSTACVGTMVLKHSIDMRVRPQVTAGVASASGSGNVR